MPPECNTYLTLSGADRSVHYGAPFLKCDRSLQPGWYRFQGAAGNRMATTCPPINRCHTAATGWLYGGHPKVEDGVVSRLVCFHIYSNCCFWSRMISIRNCGTYYVYHFLSTPACNVRYCGNGMGKFNLPSSFLSFCFFWFSVSDTQQEDLRLPQIYIYI